MRGRASDGTAAVAFATSQGAPRRVLPVRGRRARGGPVPPKPTNEQKPSAFGLRLRRCAAAPPTAQRQRSSIEAPRSTLDRGSTLHRCSTLHALIEAARSSLHALRRSIGACAAQLRVRPQVRAGALLRARGPPPSHEGVVPRVPCRHRMARARWSTMAKFLRRLQAPRTCARCTPQCCPRCKVGYFARVWSPLHPRSTARAAVHRYNNVALRCIAITT